MKIIGLLLALAYFSGLAGFPSPPALPLLVGWLGLFVIFIILLKPWAKRKSLLRFDEESLSLKIMGEWQSIRLPTAIEWRAATRFVLQARYMPVELKFSRIEDARSCATAIKNKFPGIQEKNEEFSRSGQLDESGHDLQRP